MSTVLNLRLSEPMAGKVRTLAALERRSNAEMLRLLAEEAIKLREFPDIVFTDGPTGRRATLIHGPDLWEVLEPFVLAGRDRRALEASFPELPEGLLDAAVRYYEQYPAEIDARIALNQGE